MHYINKKNTPQIIEELCFHTYKTVEIMRQAEIEEKKRQNAIRSSIRDLVVFLLQTKGDEGISDDEVNNIFVDWVKRCKQEKKEKE